MKTLLEQRNDIGRVETAANGIMAIALAKQIQPHLVMLDLALPMATGIEVLAEIRRWCAGTKVIVLTGLTAQGVLSSVLAAGADGLALKTTPLAGLASGVDQVLGGESWVSEDARSILEHSAPGQGLTARETQVLDLIVRGLTNAEIAEKLGIAIKTADNHRTHIMKKMGVRSRAQLLAAALKMGFLDSHRDL